MSFDNRQFFLRDAGRRDVIDIIEFLNTRGQDLLRSGPIQVRGNAWIERWLDRDWTRNVLMRARETDRLVGVASMHMRFTWRRGIGTIEYVLTDPNFRHQGLARALMLDLIRIARETMVPSLGKLELISEDIPERVGARRLYTSLGFRLMDGSDRHFELMLD